MLSIDEKTAIAARSGKHPGQLAGPGRPAREEFEYIRHGTASIIAALDLQTGQAITEPITHNDSVTFQRFPTMLDTCIDPGKRIHIVLDNGSSHAAKATRAWLTAPQSRPPRRLSLTRRPDQQDRNLRHREDHQRQTLPMDLRRHPAQGRMTPGGLTRRCTS